MILTRHLNITTVFGKRCQHIQAYALAKREGAQKNYFRKRVAVCNREYRGKGFERTGPTNGRLERAARPQQAGGELE